MASPELVRLKGELHQFKVRRDLWGVAIVRVHGEADILAVGQWPGAHEGDTVLVSGHWATHPTYGRQLRVKDLEITAPADASGVIAWLVSRVPHLGQARASKLVERYGVEGIWQRLEGGSEDLLEVKGITRARLEEITKAYQRSKWERETGVKLRSWGLSVWQIARATQALGERVAERIQNDPYILARKVDGIGFLKADAIARRMGYAKDSPSRIQAGILHLLEEASRSEGHVYVPAGALAHHASHLLGLEVHRIDRQIAKMVEDGALCTEGTRIYLPSHLVAEHRIAEIVRARLENSKVAS